MITKKFFAHLGDGRHEEDDKLSQKLSVRCISEIACFLFSSSGLQGQALRWRQFRRENSKFRSGFHRGQTDGNLLKAILILLNAQRITFSHKGRAILHAPCLF